MTKEEDSCLESELCEKEPNEFISLLDEPISKGFLPPVWLQVSFF